MTPAEIAAVQSHLRKQFANQKIVVATPKQRGGSVELRIGDEFIGTIHRDDEDGEVSYAIQMVVLAEDLNQIN